MPKSTPHPPSHPLAIHTPITIQAAMLQACAELSGAAATAYEAADNATLEFRPLGRSVVTQIHSATALIEASFAGLIALEEQGPAPADTTSDIRGSTERPLSM